MSVAHEYGRGFRSALLFTGMPPLLKAEMIGRDKGGLLSFIGQLALIRWAELINRIGKYANEKADKLSSLTLHVGRKGGGE